MKNDTKKFPYSTFPFRLEHMEGTDKKICWFQLQDHAEKYIERNKLKPKDYKFESKDVEIKTKPVRKRTKKEID